VRRLDENALAVAAARSGYRGARAALEAAVDKLKPPAQVRSCVAKLLTGAVPGALMRVTIAAHLGVNELELWPVEEAEVTR
jgi:hypothetical protein